MSNDMEAGGPQEEASPAEEAKYREVIAGIRGLTRYQPRLSFRIKVHLLSRWYGFARNLHRRQRETAREKPSRRPLTGFATAAVVLLVLVITFFSMTQVANASVPGDPLYWLDKLQERLTLSFTRHPVHKATLRLDLAQERLDEIRTLEDRQRLERDILKALSREADDHLAMSRSHLEESGVKSRDKELLLSRLNEVVIYRENLLAGILSDRDVLGEEIPAEGTEVTLADTAENSLLNGRKREISLTANSKGEVRFTHETISKTDAVQIEAMLEGSGIRTVWPLETRTERVLGARRYEVEVSPALVYIPCYQEQKFLINLVDNKTGKPADSRRIMLRDRSGTGLLNDDISLLEGKTDRKGRFSFKFKKISAEKVSRISLTVKGAVEEKSGDIIVLGATEPLGEGEAAATLKMSGRGEEEKLILDNDDVWVSLPRKSQDVISAVGTRTGGEIAGPLALDIKKVEELSGLKHEPSRSTRVIAGRDGSLALVSTFRFAGEKNEGLSISYKIALSSHDPLTMVDVTWENQSDRSLNLNGVDRGLPLLGIRAPGADRVEIGGQQANGNWSAQEYEADSDRPYSDIYVDGTVISLGLAEPSYTGPHQWKLSIEDGSPILELESEAAELKPNKKYHWTMFLGIGTEYGGEKFLERTAEIFPGMTSGLSPKIPLVEGERGHRVRMSPKSILEARTRITLKVLEPLP